MYYLNFLHNFRQGFLEGCEAAGSFPGQHHGVFDAHTAPTLDVNAGFDAEHHAFLQFDVAPFVEVGQLMDLEACAVPQSGGKVAAVAP